MRHDEESKQDRTREPDDTPRMDGIWEEEPRDAQPPQGAPEESAAETNGAPRAGMVTVRPEMRPRVVEAKRRGQAPEADEANDKKQTRGMGYGRRRFLALCGGIITLAAMLVIFCGLSMQPRNGGGVGTRGESGAQGEQGLQGLQGPAGPQGPQGEAGQQGAEGAPGEKGEAGAPGEPGAQGEQGLPGKSAYESYCEQFGYTGSEEEWLAEVHDRLSRYTSEEVYALAESCTVSIEAFRESDTAAVRSIGKGVGFFIASKGLIMTAYHVIDGATDIRVTMPDSAAYEVTRVVAFDRERDLAVIHIGIARDMPYLTFATEGVAAGETLYAVGGAQGSDEGVFVWGVAATGVAAASTVDVSTAAEGDPHQFLYTSSLPLENSGAPILNTYGQVVGIVTGRDEETEGLHRATYIGEAAALDMTYDSTVQDFFVDTEYYRTKWMEEKVREMENNNTMKAADLIDVPGQTFGGATRRDDPDYYSFEIKGEETVDCTMLFSVDTTDFYYPILIPAVDSNVELSWTRLETAEGRVYGARVTLTPGIYYVAVNGYYSDVETVYALYSYWRPLSEREAFAYEVTFEDAVR